MTLSSIQCLRSVMASASLLTTRGETSRPQCSCSFLMSVVLPAPSGPSTISTSVLLYLEPDGGSGRPIVSTLGVNFLDGMGGTVRGDDDHGVGGVCTLQLTCDSQLVGELSKLHVLPPRFYSAILRHLDAGCQRTPFSPLSRNSRSGEVIIFLPMSLSSSKVSYISSSTVPS